MLAQIKEVLLIGKRINNFYLLDISNSSFAIGGCLTKHEESWLWHRRIAHIHMHHLNKLISKDLVVVVYPNSSLRKTTYVKHVKRGSKLKILLN